MGAAFVAFWAAMTIAAAVGLIGSTLTNRRRRKQARDWRDVI